MVTQRQQARRRLGVHGILVFFVGVLLGIPFGLAQGEAREVAEGFAAVFGHDLALKADAELADGLAHYVHRWDIAHSQGMFHGLLLLVAAASTRYLRLTLTQLKWASFLLIVGAWATVVGSGLSAAWEVDGRQLAPPVTNMICWLLLGVGVIFVSLGIALGAVRAGWDASREWLLRKKWKNWAGNVMARPRRIERPETLQQLRDAVIAAGEDRLSIRAVGGSYSWSPAAATDGVQIDVGKLQSELGHTKKLDGTGTITVEAGMRIKELTEHAAVHGLTLASTTVIPWVQVGGAFANGCHGTGIHHPHFTELVSGMTIVRAGGEAEHYARPDAGDPQEDQDRWDALLVNLGVLGVIYSLTFDCVAMFNVRAVDEVTQMKQALIDVQTTVVENDYAEIFWFPYQEKCWVKKWNEVDEDPVPPEWKQVRDVVQWIQNKLLGPLVMHTISFFPFFTPIAMKLFFWMTRKTAEQDRIMAAPDAMQYQRSFMRVYDMGYAIPIDAEWNNVRRAWYAVVDRLEALRYERVYPQNLVLHMRFVGPGRGLLAASTGHELTCHIEMLTFHNTTRYAEFFLRIEREWRRFGGRPHWAKLSFDPARIGGLYPKQNLEKFMAIRAEMDPDELFLNDYLREVLGLL